MEILLANHSSYPPGGEVASRPFPDRSSAFSAVIREQESLGLDLLTDGQLCWADPVSHMLREVDGVRFDRTRPFLGTSLAYRQPVIEAKLRRRRNLLASEFRLARATTTRPLKAVLTGPYTLASLSEISTTAYRGVAGLAADLATILAEDIRQLVAAGAALIQIDEPVICEHPGDIRLLRELLEPLQLATGGTVPLAVATPRIDAEPLYAHLNSLPTEVLMLDFCASAALAGSVAETGSSRILALGIVDGQSPSMEDPDVVTRLVERILHRYVHDRVYLQPSCGLAHLAPAAARAKLALLTELRARLGRSPAPNRAAHAPI